MRTESGGQWTGHGRVGGNIGIGTEPTWNVSRLVFSYYCQPRSDTPAKTLHPTPGLGSARRLTGRSLNAPMTDSPPAHPLAAGAHCLLPARCSTPRLRHADSGPPVGYTAWEGFQDSTQNQLISVVRCVSLLKGNILRPQPPVVTIHVAPDVLFFHRGFSHRGPIIGRSQKYCLGMALEMLKALSPLLRPANQSSRPVGTSAPPILGGSGDPRPIHDPTRRTRPALQ
ncbi:hypothetical protein BV22DRAFT_886416 [Leucogyrophana mollusca]|uniref:Uncharacterized protein n=1 Tax=Leucogyrophana mollusca TaxID=85980 RepID=A0ACB8B168_9AGAM|nr:hypothetical protein BV22DRAFT_886416 [Leucogyrophana mollusca]